MLLSDESCECYLFAANEVNHKGHVPYVWIIGSMGIFLVLIVLSIVVYVSLRSSNCCSESQRGHSKDSDENSSHKFHILRNPSFCCASRRNISCKSGDLKQSNEESSSRQITISKGLLS